MNDKIAMFPTAQPPRADEDTAAIEQVVEQVPGEVELDRIIKAQTSGPQIARRMAELENSVWSLVGILLLLPETTRDKIGGRKQSSRHDYFFIEAWGWTIIWSYRKEKRSDAGVATRVAGAAAC